MRRGAAVLLGALLLESQAATAQRLPVSPFHARESRLPSLHAPSDSGAGRAPSPDAAPDTASRLRFPPAFSQEAHRRPPWWTPLASAALPGSGQLIMRQRRGVPFLAAEAFLVVQYLSVRGDARDFRREYQRLAQVARSFFTDDFPVGDFEYYERMEQFVESGAYDLDPNGGFQPETDTSTFNGFTWRLARRTFWENPDAPPPPGSDAYTRALEFYEERAVRDEYRWSWQNAQLEQDLFSQTIQRSNSAFRRTSQYLGVLIANHALSAIDAFVMLRLAREPGPAGEYRIEGRVPWAPLGRGAGPAHRMDRE
ncbi:MAG TPA: hypothetical protein VK922_08955 [Gemmatimonadaceae bacterium]|nr:hypothetical protein [Gemmatimonadaceae bacterium]